MALCLHPIYNKQTGLCVPCGNCVNCLKNKQNKYVVLSNEEVKRWRSCLNPEQRTGYFFTLTYDDLHVPYNNFEPFHSKSISELGHNIPSLRYSDVNATLHYLRKWCVRHNEPYDYSYLWCGEYGSKTHRPHYHLQVYGMTRKVAYKLTSYWESHFGFVHRQSFNITEKDGTNVSRYVAKYATKGAFDDIYSLQGYRPKGRLFVSHYFGNNFLSSAKVNSLLANIPIRRFLPNGAYNPDYLDYINNKLTYNLNGFKYKLPDTLVDRIFPKIKSKVVFDSPAIGKVTKESVLPVGLRAALLKRRLQKYDLQVLHSVAQRCGFSPDEWEKIPDAQFFDAYCDFLRSTQQSNTIFEQSSSTANGIFYKGSKL